MKNIPNVSNLEDHELLETERVELETLNEKYELTRLAARTFWTGDDGFSLNQTLAEWISFLNGLLAFFIIVGSGLALSLLVWPYNQGDSIDWVGFFIGSLLGIIPAIIICGTFAVFISIRRDLNLLLKHTKIYQTEHITLLARSQLREMLKEKQNRRRQNLRINRKARC